MIFRLAITNGGVTNVMLHETNSRGGIVSSLFEFESGEDFDLKEYGNGTVDPVLAKSVRESTTTMTNNASNKQALESNGVEYKVKKCCTNTSGTLEYKRFKVIS